MIGARLAMIAALALAAYEAAKMDVAGVLIMLACYYVASLLNGETPPT